MGEEVITKAAALAAFGDNQAALARALGIRPQAVQQWADEAIPPLRVFQLAQKYPHLFAASAKPTKRRAA